VFGPRPQTIYKINYSSIKIKNVLSKQKSINYTGNAAQENTFNSLKKTFYHERTKKETQEGKETEKAKAKAKAKERQEAQERQEKKT
jgi:hypothetical protein